MLTLYLLRHAKSSWVEPGLSDHDRPLDARGQRDAPRMAEYMAEQFPPPQLILCSTARRTRETLDLMLPKLGGAAPEVLFEDTIYEVPPSRLMARLRKLPNARRNVLVIGHNPGMHGTALDLTGAADIALVRDMATKYPTCALAVLAFETDNWADVRPAAGHLTHFVKPRDLDG